MTHRRRRLGLIAATAVALAVTGCAGGGGEEVEESPSVVSETGPSQSEEPEESAAVDPSVPVAEGSGCEPGAEELPDGQWYGTVQGLTAEELELDVACWYIGEDAAMAAEEDGEESPPPNDYYVRDVDDEVSVVPVAPDATAVVYPTTSPESQEGSVADLVATAETRGGFPYGVWVEVVDGAVVSLQEQWVP